MRTGVLGDRHGRRATSEVHSHGGAAGAVAVMIILGLHAFTHDSAAAVAVDGRLVAFRHEERLSRRKNDGGFPRAAITACLADAGIGPRDVDRVVLGFRPQVGALRRLAYQLRRPGRGVGAALRLAGRGRANLSLGRDLRELGIAARVSRVDHHAAHARCVLGTTDAARAAVLVVDGVAEAWSGASFLASRDGKPALEVIERVRFPASLGLVYAAVTEHLGLRHNREEGKVMAMAALGSDELVAPFAGICGLRGNRPWLDHRCFDFGGRWTTPFFARRFGPRRSPGEPFGDGHFALARAVQEAVEGSVAMMATRLVTATGVSTLGLTGGLALNPALNSAVHRRICDAVDRELELVLFPAGGDAGTAAGAALAFELDPRWRFSAPFWGHRPSPGEVDGALARAGLEVVASGREVVDRAARLLADGRLGGWCAGRSEMGPRALGHRSILADPRRAEVRDRLNHEIKRREWFQPYGATALLPAATGLIPGLTQSPFMLRTWPVPEPARQRLSAVVHADGTSRLQTVIEGDGSGLAGLLAAFARLTGVPVVLNTSLNRRGEPLAETVTDAVDIFLATGLDFLVVEDRLALRGQP